MVAVKIVQHRHVERCGCSALFFESANMEIVVTGAAVRQPVDQPRISVIGKDHRGIGAEHGIEFTIRKTMGVLARRLKCHQVDDIDHPYFDVGEMLTKEVDGGQCFKRGDIARTRHHRIRSEEHTSELQSQSNLVCRLLLEKKKKIE